MPTPQTETFYGEGLLVPYVHYVPLRDNMSDLMEQIEYCEARLEVCATIAKNAREYAAKFSNIADLYLEAGGTLMQHLFRWQEILASWS